ncbi:MAG: Fe(3+) ABC transporter substrate-binding protein [Alphaproteobacteria bacterium]|nr:Fe(3+) ABC transporter substrate-binding protein [Alphaproteobacteria bacterium]
MRIDGWKRLGVAALAIAALAAPALLAGPAAAREVVNLYSSRHYDTDERLYTDFEAQTGIRVNRIEDSPSALIARLKAEGRNSPADLYITADVGMLWAAEEQGLLQPVKSAILEAKVPAHLRHPDGLWFGFSKRARLIFYDKARVDPAAVDTYEKLADPANKGLLCTRSSGNVYMLSLLASLIAHHGAGEAESWAAGAWANRARDPEGGDTDQLKGIASGECGVALSNHYYYIRALTSRVQGLDEKEIARVGVLFPDQDGNGTHVNISGGGVTLHAPHRENAIRFLEYLVSPSAQTYFSNGNYEFPVVEGVEVDPHVAALGAFKADELPLARLGENQAEAQRIYDRVGYK